MSKIFTIITMAVSLYASAFWFWWFARTFKESILIKRILVGVNFSSLAKSGWAIALSLSAMIGFAYCAHKIWG